MKIAISGSSGFVGAPLVRTLALSGHDVIGLDIAEGRDITDWKSLDSFDRFDACIHLAGRSFIPASFKQPREFYLTNSIGTLNMLELCRIFQAKLIFASCYVYGRPRYLPIDERHPLEPSSPYARSKVMGELLCEAYHKDFGVPVTILRLFNLYGPGQDERFLIPTILRQARSGEVRLKDPRPRRDFLYLDDFLDVCRRVLDRQKAAYEVLNIGSGRSYSIQEIVTAVGRALNADIDVSFDGEKRPGEILDTIADISKAAADLDFVPKIDLEEGLHKILSP